ncbi:hypothetical protein [Streptomyces peucetius]|uniref:Uncharacterized protein n=1 Tax=Streptomyces peucetius TaxID=1950 RepID=A0ABY6I4R7_STRPE|nr:hypothetical protein [Streptomyces peucetius]UYQ60997.1 hypothetical protein OGH68_05645 [Streptomyces peucetius]
MTHIRQSKQLKQSKQSKQSRQPGRSGRSRRPGDNATLRRALRREVPSTVGILADEQDFTRMRRYRTFAFDDYPTYLKQCERLLKTLSAQQLHTSVALFDPDEFAEYCAEAGIDADTPAGRSRFTAELAGRGPSVPYTGRPLTGLLPELVNRTVRQATWEYATLLLADLGVCADCGQDIGSAAFERASRILMRLLELAGPGEHHVVCSVPGPDEQLLAVLHAHGGPSSTAQIDATEGTEFVTVLAAGIALEGSGGMVLRTSAPGTPDHLHGWRLHQGRLDPLTAGEVFSAYCTDAATGDPLSPEPGVEYCAGFPVTTDDPDSHH